jgi:inosine-uridine nucleoside N-ribohydrolase
VEFKVSIPELGDLTLTDLDVIHQIILIRITRQGRLIELANEEYQFFYALLVGFVIDFYNRRRHDPIFRATYKVVDGSVPIKEASAAKCFIDPETCHLLNQSKFGCRLAVD